MVATTGTIKAGSFTGQELEHYIVSNGGPNFTLQTSAKAAFEIIECGRPGPGIGATIALIGELKATGHIVNGQKFALAAGHGWTATSLGAALGCTVMRRVY